MGHNEAAYIHTIVEALKLAYADRHHYYGDPNFVDVPMEALLSDEHAERRRKMIDAEKASPGMPEPGSPADLGVLAAGPAADYASQVQFGLASRFAIAIIAMVVVTVLWIADSQRIIVRNLVYVSLLSLSALSFLEYVGTIGPDVERRREIVADLDAVTTQFLASNPNGVVLCPRNEVSSVCMAGYAFNRARTRESLKKLPSEWLFDGRVRYLYSTRRLLKEGWNGIDTALLVDWSYQINTIKDSVVENRRVIYSKAGYEASIIPIEQSMRAPDS